MTNNNFVMPERMRFSIIIHKLLCQLHQVEGWKTHSWKEVRKELIRHDLLKSDDIDKEFTAFAAYKDYAIRYLPVDNFYRSFNEDKEYWEQYEKELKEKETEHYRIWLNSRESAFNLFLFLLIKFCVIARFNS